MKKQKRMKQITAILLIVILLAIIGSTIYFAVSGSQLFWMSLFLMFFLHNPDNSAQRCFQIRIGNRF